MKYQLSDVDINMLERVCKKIRVSTGIDDDGYIEIDNLLGIIEELEDKYDEAEEDIEDYKDNYRPIGDESGWDLAHCYQREMENEREFLEDKGLWKEYKERYWNEK